MREGHRRALDREFLADVGLGRLPEGDQASLLEALTAELELRVGTRLAAAMTNEQIHEFEDLMSVEDRPAASDFLQRVVPWREQAVVEELEQLSRLLSVRAPEIMEKAGDHPWQS